MKKILLQICFSLFAVAAFGQAGHVMQGVGAVKMSMGGAATGQPLDISGALQWNPAAISTFDNTIIKLDIGLFFSSPELSSSLPQGMLWPADAFGPGSPPSPPVSGKTLDDRGISPMPALAMVWGKEGSKHTFGASVFGISGFGVTFPQETNLPMDAVGNPNPDWDPNNSNPITYPQNMNGFGLIESDYMLLQIGFTYAYEISEKFSIGIEPTFNYGTLQLAPNPTTAPDFTPPSGAPTDKKYPVTDKASTTGFGGQIGLFYNSGNGFKAGASYKTEQFMSELDFQNTYLDGSSAPNNLFTMNYPSIISVGLGYTLETFDFAVDYRFVDYENTDGFAEKGWTQTGSVAGFGWQNMNIISAGIQYKGIEKLPIRVGYTYSSNPITEELAFFSVSAPAVINNAFQIGLSFIASDKFSLDAMYHHGMSDDTVGQLLSPAMVPTSPPYGPIPGTSVSYKMATDLIMIGASYTFNK
jgi:long-chain fatty acid transport protein